MLTQLPEDDRKIHFYYDPAGAAGKTWFIRYMFSQDPENVQILGNGTYDTKRIYLFNIPRNGMQYLPYRVLEGLKDRAIMSNKYMSQMKILQYQPHVCLLKVFPLIAAGLDQDYFLKQRQKTRYINIAEDNVNYFFGGQWSPAT